MAYATSADVAVIWGRTPTAEEAALIERRLSQVERMIIRRIPDLDDQIADGTIDVDDVIQVEADTVLRLVRNPDGYVSETDGNYTYLLAQDTAPGRLEISAQDWETLGVSARGFFQLVPSYEMPT